MYSRSMLSAFSTTGGSGFKVPPINSNNSPTKNPNTEIIVHHDEKFY